MTFVRCLGGELERCCPFLIRILRVEPYPRDLAALARATVTRCPAILRTRKLSELDAAMCRDMTIHLGKTPIALPLIEIDRILSAREDNPTFGNVRELYARDVYLGHLKPAKPIRRVLDLGANRGMFSLLAFLTLQSEITIGVEPIALYESVYALLLSANGISPERAPRYVRFAASPTLEQQDPAKYVSVKTIFQENKIDRFELVKIDIEGWEKDLFSEPEWLERVDNITMELHPAFVKDLSPIPRALDRYGFKYIMVNQAGRPDTIDSAMFLHASCTGALIN